MPKERLIETLKELCADRRNTVFVVSGKERHSLTETLCHIPNLGLASEHGMFVSWPTPKVGPKRVWETLVPNQDQTWKSIAIAIMQVYTSRTHGSYIEETEMKVLWQYRDADPEFGFLQSKELEDHLANVLRGFSVDILHGGVEEGGYVEVRPKGVNKGVAAMHIINNLEKIPGKRKVDFALVMGDDHCDEPMLSVMRQVGRRAAELRSAKSGTQLAPLPATIAQVDVSSCDDHVSPTLQVFTATVGKKPSAAANYVNEVDEVHELLASLVKVTTREKVETVHNGFYSVLDLKSMGGAGAGNKSPSTLKPVLSMSELKTATGEDFEVSFPTQRVSTNLADFLGMGMGMEDAHHDSEDEEDIFF